MSERVLVEQAQEWLNKAGLGDIRYGCADMCDCERCARTLGALLLITYQRGFDEAKLAMVFMLQGMQSDAVNLVDRGNVIDRIRALERKEKE